MRSESEPAIEIEEEREGADADQAADERLYDRVSTVYAAHGPRANHVLGFDRDFKGGRDTSRQPTGARPFQDRWSVGWVAGSDARCCR
jgi:hypothetical protein